MKKRLRSDSTLKTLKIVNRTCWFFFIFFLLLSFPNMGMGRIIVDIDRPFIQKIKIAIPDFKVLTTNEERPALAQLLPEIISNDLNLSGYFEPMDKKAFLDEDGPLLTEDNIRFRNWSVIGAELLLKGGFISIGRSIEVEVRLYDVVRNQQLLGKRVLGKLDQLRSLMHRIGNEIITTLTGYYGIFLTRITFEGRSPGSSDKEIYICDFDGHNVQKLTSDQSTALLPKWSPKGDKIIYNSYKDGGTNLYLRDLSSGEDRQLSSRAGLNVGAEWVPNDEKLVLTLSIRGDPDIFAIDLKGRIVGQYTKTYGIDISPSFSPDGTKMVFVSDRYGSPQLYIKDLKSGHEKRLTFPGDFDTEFEGKFIYSPNWSSRDRIVFAGSNDGEYDIYTINPDGSHLRKLTEWQEKNEDPCWSPDGRYIVFSSNRTGEYHLYIMNANGQNQRQITFQPGEQTAPAWSPF